MVSRSIKQFLQCKSTIKSELKEGLENLNESLNESLDRLSFEKKKYVLEQGFLAFKLYNIFYMRHRDWSNPFPFHDELLQVFILRMYDNYRIENRAHEEPPVMLFTSATGKDGIPPPPVGLSWDSPHPPTESVRADVRWRQNQNFSDQRVTKFAYP